MAWVVYHKYLINEATKDGSYEFLPVLLAFFVLSSTEKIKNWKNHAFLLLVFSRLTKAFGWFDLLINWFLFFFSGVLVEVVPIQITKIRFSFAFSSLIRPANVFVALKHCWTDTQDSGESYTMYSVGLDSVIFPALFCRKFSRKKMKNSCFLAKFTRQASKWLVYYNYFV